jgi:predicted Zn-dependent peptidase
MSCDKHIYENGFRLIHEKAPFNTSQVAINVFCDIGSIHESHENLRGAAHFIEHMCFKGTTRLPDTHTLSLVFDKSGAFLNAFTDRRYTCYYATGLSTHLCEYINALGDMLLYSVFKKTEYDKEHDVVREEMTKDIDDAENTVLENADQILYAGSTCANPVDLLKYHTGSQSLKHTDVFNFYNQYYVPSRFILSVCSSKSFAEIKKCVDASPFAKSHKMPIVPAPSLILGLAPQTGVQYIIRKQSGISSAHICIGFRTCGISNSDRYCLKVLKNVLGETMNARLFFILREYNGLSYTSTAMCDYFEHSGDIKIYAECDDSKVFRNGNKKGVFPLLINMIKDLVKNGITTEEMHTTKNYLKGKMKMKSEDCEIISKHNGKSELFGLPQMKYEDVYKKCIEHLTKKDVNECIKKYFRKDNMVISVISSNPEVVKQEKYELREPLFP